MVGDSLIVEIECPVCGEPMSIYDGDDMTICENCGAWLDIDEDGTVSHSAL